MTTRDTNFDWARQKRTGIPEVVLAEHKSVEQIHAILQMYIDKDEPLLITRLTPEQIEYLKDAPVLLNEIARTATFKAPVPQKSGKTIAIVAAGTSDLPVALETQISANFLGLNTKRIMDVGVAGLWRLEASLEEIEACDLVIAIAGMEGALFPVLAGLTTKPMIAVPTSIGYGIAKGGKAALSTALASCAPGIVTVNIDNGFGAAAAAKKFL